MDGREPVTAPCQRALPLTPNPPARPLYTPPFVAARRRLLAVALAGSGAFFFDFAGACPGARRTSTSRPRASATRRSMRIEPV
jgi:hypothetical protein